MATNREILEQAADGARPPLDWSHTDLTEREAERIVETAQMAFVAAQMPRRGGHGIGARELAKDKKVSKCVARTYWDLWRRMNAAQEAPKPPDWDRCFAAAARQPSARRAGATVLWSRWITTRRKMLIHQRRKIAAYALREGHIKWGARRVMLIDVELRGLDRAEERM